MRISIFYLKGENKMKINKNKFIKLIKEVIEENKEELYKYQVEDLSFQYVNIRKNRNTDSYNIEISVDEIETPLILIRDIIEESAQKIGININKITVEI